MLSMLPSVSSSSSVVTETPLVLLALVPAVLLEFLSEGASS